MKYVVATALISPFVLGAVAQADSLNNFSEAVGDSADASARIVASGGQVVIGATALPLALAGTGLEGAGQLSKDMANELWGTTNTPLKIDEDIVIAQTPPTLADIQKQERK